MKRSFCLILFFFFMLNPLYAGEVVFFNRPAQEIPQKKYAILLTGLTPTFSQTIVNFMAMLFTHLVPKNQIQFQNVLVSSKGASNLYSSLDRADIVFEIVGAQPSGASSPGEYVSEFYGLKNTNPLFKTSVIHRPQRPPQFIVSTTWNLILEEYENERLYLFIVELGMEILKNINKDLRLPFLRNVEESWGRDLTAEQRAEFNKIYLRTLNNSSKNQSRILDFPGSLKTSKICQPLF